MKRNMIVAIATCLLVSCSSKDLSLDEPSSLSQPLVVRSSLLCEGVTTKGLLAGGEMGVFRTLDNGYIALNNIKYVYGTPSWSTDATIYVSGSAATIIGYYPYNSAYSDCTTIPLASELFIGEVPVSKELSYENKSKSVTNSAASVAFTLNYAYTKVLLNIKKTTYQGVGNITKITFNNAGICKTGTLNMSTAAYTATTSGSLSLTPASTLTIPTYVAVTDSKTVNVLMIPCTLTGGSFTISLIVDGQTITSNALTLASFVAANKYAYTLDLSATSTGFAAVSCSDWSIIPMPVINPSIN